MRLKNFDVFLATEKAIVRLDPAQVELPDIRAAIQSAGYDAPASDSPEPAPVSMDNASTSSAVKELITLAPRTARVERGGVDVEVPA